MALLATSWAFLKRPKISAFGGVVSGGVEALSLAQMLPQQYSTWVTPVAFIAFAGFMTRLGLSLQEKVTTLEDAAKPRLSLHFKVGVVPYDELLRPDKSLRMLRIGVLNSGASVDKVAVILTRIEPNPAHGILMRELERMHYQGFSRFTVNKSDEPLVFVDLVHQSIRRNSAPLGATSSMGIAFANTSANLPLDVDQYLIWLAIDGSGAQSPRKFVLKRNKDGRYDLSHSTVPHSGAGLTSVIALRMR